MQRLAACLLTSAFMGTLSVAAGAYCRTHTCEFAGREVCEVDPVTGCGSGGVPAGWGSSCLSFAVQVEGSADEGISALTLRQLVSAGFRTWSDAECEGVGPSVLSPSLRASFRGETDCDQVEYNCGEPNDNIVMFRDTGSSLSANTIALSTIIANLRTGEILDVDIELNSQDFDFYISPAPPTPGAQDLRLVLNHELGHMLGLSHSRDAQALMRAEYEGSNPLPAADDVRGMCSVFEPSEADPACPVAAIEGGGACVGSDGRCPAPIGAASQRSGCVLGPRGVTGSGAFSMGLGLGLCAVLRRRANHSKPTGRGARARLRRFHG